ncbi:hypothetical protein CO005_02085 [Candidatus Roizmanbacteria bacterium CG_4_8_14_3_um_filter_34_9]|uniref:Uncharacterized protein n=3 Tax=Candidatus Roizmaniibacteriota TaxID=1752723 RepID=A0A2M7AU37_9BACT|nr:MAG: hypothetical protein COT02_03220 [Candidatus Roizmanbacteria bacterium CG07_land_8_20_14_0_80_34_15]PIU74144.1 MAG: hypothetical protein COS77_03095 [Candidatus Roizmanbacteria bacterium CG06_land_8_20_14_3_00_34_14]PIW73316.1 MAG: hypothetical protein CO005_02085 [Candidatus Roizmanbacteria bacterium CG_4_8_14_3_um_filter_34_9]
MNTNQIQIKVSVSEQLSNLLRYKADRLGIPVTQLVKYILIKDVEKENPVFTVSDQLEKISEKAIGDLNNSIIVDNIDDFFNKL